MRSCQCVQRDEERNADFDAGDDFVSLRAQTEVLKAGSRPSPGIYIWDERA